MAGSVQAKNRGCGAKQAVVCGLPRLTHVAEAGSCGVKQMGNYRKRKKNLTVKAAEGYPGELGCAE